MAELDNRKQTRFRWCQP